MLTSSVSGAMISLLEVAKRNYRLAFLFMALNFLVPPLVLAAFISTLVTQIPSYRALIYIFAVPAYWTVKVQHDNYVKRRDAALMGAVLAPEVKGKWPGNLDLIFQYVYSCQSERIFTSIPRQNEQSNEDELCVYRNRITL